MPSKSLNLCLLAGLLLLPFPAPLLAAGELLTLFTTPQERQLINSNRYKSDEAQPQPVNEEPEQLPVQLIPREEVSIDYRVSGISRSVDGIPTVWINAHAYQDGEQLEDGSRIKVIAGDELRVRITAPDGRQYYATSGETVTVTYMAAVEN
jgi:hypothetical protein